MVALQNFYLEEAISGIRDIIIKPANRSNISSWEKIYNLVGQAFPKDTVVTSVDKKRIPPYFNSGVIGLRNSIREKFSQTWVKYFEGMWEEQEIRKFGIPSFHRDQVALSLTLNELNIKPDLLQENYNFPLRGKKINKKTIPFLAHYHRPYMVYSSKLLKEEFLRFLTEYPEFKSMIGNFPDWKRFFGSNAVVAGINGLKEAIRYKKYILTKNSSRTF